MNGGRESKTANVPERYRVADLLIDVGRQCVKRGDAEIPLPKLSFDLLLVLVRAAPNVLSHDELMSQVWPRLVVSPETVSQRVKLLRDALGDDSREPRYIAAMRGRGYRLLPDAALEGASEPSSVVRSKPGGAPRLAFPGTRRGVAFAALLAAGAGLLLYGVVSDVIRPAGDRTPPAEAASRPPNSVAVLPFVNVSNDPGNDYFCDGVSEEILHRLSDYRDMHVLGRQSSFAFKGSKLDVPRLSELLGVRYLLQGSVRKENDQVRISAQLVDDRGFQVWSESYDRKLTGVLEIQAEIAAAVAQSLAQSIVASRVTAPSYTPDIQAYEEFLLGREYLRRRTPGYSSRAVEHFDRAIKLDPAYPQPHAGRAIALLLTWDAADHAGQLEEARRSIDQALALEPGLGLAWAAEGLLQQVRNPPDFKASEQALRRALAIDPYLPAVRGSWLSNALSGQGSWEAARAETAIALARDPLDPLLVINDGRARGQAGDFAGAEQRLKRLLDLPEPPVLAYRTLGDLYNNYGRYVELVNNTEQLIRAHVVQGANAGQYLSFLAVAYATVGLWAEADEWQSRAETLSPDEMGTTVGRAFIHRLRGEFDAMARAFDRAVAAGNIERAHPWMQQLRGVIEVERGAIHEGIELLEAMIDVDKLGADFQEIDFVQLLALAHQEAGNRKRARELLEYVGTGLEASRARGEGRDPISLMQLAQNHLLTGDREAARAGVETAIGAGYRGYYFTVHDRRWSALRDDARFEALLMRMKGDVDAQRAQIEQAGGEQEFAALLEALVPNPLASPEQRR